jgi:hypothetical protein
MDRESGFATDSRKLKNAPNHQHPSARVHE